MDRRGFFRAGAHAAVAGAIVAGPSGPAQAAPRAGAGTPAILAGYSAADHRRRLENVGLCQRAIRTCMRRHLITSYLPAQCCYNLGEYPCRKPWDPDEYDERELDKLREHGIQLIQVFDEWNDSLRLFGGHKLTALNAAGFRRFVEMVHRRGMKIITYLSSGYLQRTDPDFRPEWAREGDVVVVGYWNMARCSPASPGWRAYLLPHVGRILDDYGLDGLYNDWGYLPNKQGRPAKPTKDEVPAFEESPALDGAVADLLQLIYAEVHRRGGIVKLHADGANQPMVGGAKVYDYLWVGEGVGNAEGLREAVKNHPPYVVPCLDMTFAKIQSDDEPYLHAIPYMQFPVLQAGRPFTGERGMIPGVPYPFGDKDFWVQRCQTIWKHYQAHPNGPFTYGGWDAVPGRAETRPTHARWLRQYLPLAEEGTWAWLEIGDSTVFARPLPAGVVASAFANRDLYLVLANFTQAAAEVACCDTYVPVANPQAAPARQWSLPRRSLHILRRTG